MNLDGAAVDQHRLESLDAETVQRRCAVEQYRPLFDNLFQDIVDFRSGPFDQSAGAFNIMCQVFLYQVTHHKGFKKIQGHAPRQTALMQFQFGADYDDRTSAVVDALSQQVLAETTLLASQHIRKGFQFVIPAD